MDRSLSPARADHLARLHASTRERAIRDSAEADTEVLGWRAEGLTFAAIAARLGVSRGRAYQRVTDAERRRKLREEETTRTGKTSSGSGPKG